MPKIVVTIPLVAVTVTYNGLEVVDEFLTCTLQQQDIGFHLVIVDNASGDGTRARLATIDDPRVTVIFNDENVGVAAANNQGIAWARDHQAKRILLINNDTEFNDDLFARLDAQLTELGGDAISPLIPFHDVPDRAWFAGGSFVRWRGVMSYHDNYNAPVKTLPRGVQRIEYAPTCCLLIDAQVFSVIGMMDENYFVYWDDSDFCWRMSRAELTIWYDPGLTLLHKVSSSTGGSDSDFSIRYIHRNQMYFVRKFHSQFWLLYTMLVMTIKVLLRLLFSSETARQTRLRFAAMREGLAMPLPVAS